MEWQPVCWGMGVRTCLLGMRAGLLGGHTRLHFGRIPFLRVRRAPDLCWRDFLDVLSLDS